MPIALPPKPASQSRKELERLELLICSGSESADLFQKRAEFARNPYYDIFTILYQNLVAVK